MTRTLRIIILSNSRTKNTTNFDLRSLHRTGWLSLRFVDRALGFNVLQDLPSSVKSLKMEGFSLNRYPIINRRIPTIQNIFMRRNNLTSVSLDSFEDMPFSNGLDVYGNALHQLPDLYSIPSLRVLKLNGNPLEFTGPYVGWSCDRTWWHQG